MAPVSAEAAAVDWAWDTPAGTGAIAVCRLVAREGCVDSLERALESLTGTPAPAAGALAHRRFADFDDGIVARPTDRVALLMPHGGEAIRRRLDDWLRDVACAAAPAWPGCAAGASARTSWAAYPEAASHIEALALDAIAGAASPRAVPLLLSQPEAFCAAAARGWRPGPADEARTRRLSRLLRPPLVVAVGASNAGKSSLLNALAGRTVAIAADLPGTTRDCVGARVMLDGLAVDWLDTPGIRDADDALEREACAIARALAQRADLIIGIHAHDAPLPRSCADVAGRAPDIIIRTKCDLDSATHAQDHATAHAQAHVAAHVSAVTRAGLQDLAVAVRSALVPDSDLASGEPWCFHPALA